MFKSKAVDIVACTASIESTIPEEYLGYMKNVYEYSNEGVVGSIVDGIGKFLSWLWEKITGFFKWLFGGGSSGSSSSSTSDDNTAKKADEKAEEAKKVEQEAEKKKEEVEEKIKEEKDLERRRKYEQGMKKIEEERKKIVEEHLKMAAESEEAVKKLKQEWEESRKDMQEQQMPKMTYPRMPVFYYDPRKYIKAPSISSLPYHYISNFTSKNTDELASHFIELLVKDMRKINKVVELVSKQLQEDIKHIWNHYGELSEKLYDESLKIYHRWAKKVYDDIKAGRTEGYTISEEENRYLNYDSDKPQAYLVSVMTKSDNTSGYFTEMTDAIKRYRKELEKDPTVGEFVGGNPPEIKQDILDKIHKNIHASLKEAGITQETMLAGYMVTLAGYTVGRPQINVHHVVRDGERPSIDHQNKLTQYQFADAEEYRRSLSKHKTLLHDVFKVKEEYKKLDLVVNHASSLPKEYLSFKRGMQSLIDIRGGETAAHEYREQIKAWEKHGQLLVSYSLSSFQYAANLLSRLKWVWEQLENHAHSVRRIHVEQCYSYVMY